MRSNKQFYTPKGSYQAGLYSFVFTRRIPTFAVVFLFISFLIQPFHQALANEAVLEDLPETVLPDEVAEQLPDPVDSESEVVEQPEEEEQVETSETTDEPTEDTVEDIVPDEEDTTEEETATTTQDAAEDEETQINEFHMNSNPFAHTFEKKMKVQP